MKVKDLTDLRKAIKYNVKLARKKFHQRHIKSTTLALLLTLPYLLFEWTARAFDLYTYFPSVDIFVHTSFGIAFAAITLLIYEKNLKFTIFWAFIVAVLWEAIEIIGDFIPVTAVFLDPFFYDGVTDILFTFLGAVVTVYILRKLITRHYFRIPS